MAPKQPGAGDPPREGLEKFSLRWYTGELRELFIAAAEAQRLSKPEFAYVTAFLQELANHFLKPDQIQQHHQQGLLDEYRGKVAGLERGTAEFFTTVELGRWLRVCQEAIAQGRSPEEISRLVTPLITAKLTEFGLQPPPAPVIPPPPPVPAAPARHTPRPIAAPLATPVEPPVVAVPVTPAREPWRVGPPPKPELPAGTIEAVTVDEAERVLANTEIHGDAYDGRNLTVAMLRSENLGPRYKTTIDGKTVWFASAAYEVFDRLAVVAYVEQNPGQYTARTYYRSNSHGIWKYLPRYSGYDAHVNHFNKGFGQESISLPWQSQKALAEVSHNRVRVSDPKLMFVGTARKNDGYEPHGTYFAGVNRRGARLPGGDHTQPTGGGKNKPERVLIAQEAQRPNFGRRIATWNYETAIYGQVTAEVYASQDQTLQFVFCRDARNRVWIASVENITSAPGPTGLRDDWVDAKDLTTPAYDYAEESEGYGDAFERTGNYVDMYHNYISKIPVIQAYIRFFNIPKYVPASERAAAIAAPRVEPVAAVPLPARPVVAPTAPVRPAPPKPQSNLGRIGFAAATAVGLAVGGYELNEHIKQTKAIAAAEAARLEQIKHQYDHIPPSLRDHLVGVPDVGTVQHEFQPRADWVPQGDGSYLWGERTLLAEPDGSAVYIPADTKYNKAFILPANARGNIDWRGARFPVQAINNMDLSLTPNGLWVDPQGGQYAVLDGGHLLYADVEGHSGQFFLPFNQSELEPIEELDTYYNPPIDLSKIDTTIPVGFVDVEAQPSLQTIQVDLSYRTYNNTAAGVPIYPPDYKCMIPEGAVDNLAAVEAELSALGRHLTIGDAKRPLIVQAFLREVLGKWASKPTPQAHHVAGMALDIGLLDATYLPVFGGGYHLPSPDSTAGKSLRSPKDKQQALAQGWSDSEYEEWKRMHDIFVKHGFTFNENERWHVDMEVE